MKTRFAIGILALALAVGGAAHASLISVDADAFAAGTNISTAFAGVTLSAVGAGFDGDFDAAIFALPGGLLTPSTGSLVFGTNDPTWPELFSGVGNAVFRVDFAAPTSTVYLDALADDTDFARLDAYNSSGVLISSYATAMMTGGTFETMMVSGNISYVIASGVSGDAVGFDNLLYEGGAVVPEPATLSLLGLGLSSLMVSRLRRRKS